LRNCFWALVTVFSIINKFKKIKMNIYVGNLSWSLSNSDLEKLFAPYGEVISAKIVTDKFNSDRSKGFGFVEMPDEAANAAIAALNETEVGGRKIVVSPKREGESGGGGGYKKRNFGGGGYRERNNY
jgi:RNA recognition motif-containing protein